MIKCKFLPLQEPDTAPDSSFIRFEHHPDLRPVLINSLFVSIYVCSQYTSMSNFVFDLIL